MSALLMGLVWGIELSPPKQAVMLALADHAKDDGTDIYPSVELIAWKVGKKVRQVQYILRTLEHDKLLIPVAFSTGGRGHATRYEMHLENGVLKPALPRKGAIVDAPFTDDNERVQSTAPITRERVQSTAPITRERVQSDDTKGAVSRTQRVQFRDIKGAIAIAPEPSEPSYKPPEEVRARACATLSQENENEAEAEPEAEPPLVPRRPPYDDRAFRRWALSQTGGWTNLSPKRLDVMMDRYCREKGIPL